MSENEQQSPAPEAQHESEQVQEALALLRRYGVPLLVAAAVVLVLAVGIRAYRNRIEQARQDAARALFTAQSVQDLEGVLERAGSAPAAPLAMLRVAKAHYDAANYELAMNKYDAFLLEFPEHDFTAAARFGRIACLEARGEITEALRRYTEFADGHAGHYLRPQAVFGRARCLRALGRVEEARVVYEDFLAEQPDSGWAVQADEALEEMEEEAAASDTNTPQPVDVDPAGMVPVP